MRRIYFSIAPILISLSLQACATSTDSTLLGIGIGSIVGAAVGTVASKSGGSPQKAAAIGMVVGGTVGGLSGFLQHREFENEKLRLKLGLSSPVPKLTVPKVQKVWVPAKVENDIYIDGHYQFQIQEPSRWNPEDEREAKPPIQSNPPTPGKTK